MPVQEDSMHAIKFIEAIHQAGKPFFVNLWMHEPRTPFHTVPKYRWGFGDSGLGETDEIFASVLSHADDRIGTVLKVFDRLHVADNTFVIFSSNNEPARSANAELDLMHDTATGAGLKNAAAKGITVGRKGYKAALFEGGITVPFIARCPGKISVGEVDTTSIISAVDLLPTFCDIDDAALPKSFHGGFSQIDVLTGTSSTVGQRPLFWKMSGGSGRFRATENPETKTSITGCPPRPSTKMGNG